MSKHTATWKAVERRVARQLGGRRMGPGGDRADVRSDWLCVEVKHRAALPAWLTDALGQAKGYATADQLPIAVLHEHGRHDALVVLSLSDFVEWFGEVSHDCGGVGADVHDPGDAGGTASAAPRG